MTLFDYDANTAKNERVSLDGVVLDAAVTCGKAELTLALCVASAPDGWMDVHAKALFLLPHASDPRGMHAYYLVNGERHECERPASGAPAAETVFILPVFPSNYAALSPLPIELTLARWTELNGTPCPEDQTEMPLPSAWNTAGGEHPLTMLAIDLPK